MSGADDARAPVSEAEGDLEYDLAHEWTSGPERHAPVERQTVCVAIETDDHDGDYGYDLAHDVPGR